MPQQARHRSVWQWPRSVEMSIAQKLSQRKQEVILALVVLAEILIFSITGENFFSQANFFECIRLSVEIGLLALALTPVIITGGIDLSVGSMMGLSAVVLGVLWHDAGWPLGVAMLAALATGILGGCLNALLISRWNISPLIVTLGTYSLFRGLAEGKTEGAQSYANLPAGFLYLGQGYIGGVIPTQMLFLVAAAVGYWLLLHRSIIGRALYAIGFSKSGARYAAIPVARRLALVYILSGFCASLAAIIYVAHIGQAKSDAGTSYELIAITAVVLGGTSIFGGRGTIVGTLLGLAAIVILQNGLRLAALPAELTGICTGILLVLTVGLDSLASRTRAASHIGTEKEAEEEEMKNSQVATICVAVLAGAVIVAASNWYLVKSLRNQQQPVLNGMTSGGKQITIGVLPKAKGDPYFISCQTGAEEAAKELGINIIWDGPTELDPAKQNEVVEGWITRKVDAIAVSVNNEAAISTVLRKARSKGIKVVTWDADAAKDARDFFVNQATPQGIGYTLTDEAAKVLHEQGEFAVITGSLSAANQNNWIKYIRERVSQKYPKMKLVVIRPSDDDRDRAFSETQTILKVYPNVKVIVGIAAPAVPGAAEAVKQARRTDVKVVGLSLPNLCKPYVHANVIQAVVLWKTRDLTYLTVHAATQLVKGELKPGATSMTAGRLGKIEIEDSDIILGKPFVFTKENIDQFDF